MKRSFLILLLSVTLAATHSPARVTRAIVMGLAQDGGIPQIGCTQRICKTQHHFVSSLALAGDDSLLLIDATPDLRDQYRELIERHPELSRKSLFDGIFLTHAHMGHYTGLLYLGKESISTSNVPVYCSAEMADFLEGNEPWSLLISNHNIDLRVFHDDEPIVTGGFTITPLPVPHRREFTDTHGFLIRGQNRSLLYIPDIDSWTPAKDQMKEWLNQSDIALLDGTFYSGKELPGRDMSLVPHPTVQSAVAFFQALAPFKSRIYFTHLNHTNPLLDPSSSESQSLKRTPYRVVTEWEEFGL